MFNFRTSSFGLFVAVSTIASQVLGQSEFITTWQTDNSGASNNTEITIPTNSGFSYAYDVDWNNDGTFDEFGISGDITHDFGTSGTYTVRIQGAFPAIRFNNGGDRLKLLSVDQWGDIAWESFESAFEGCANFTIAATDAPDLSNVADLGSAFKYCTMLNAAMDHWDVSNVTNFNSVFHSTSVFDQDLSRWNFSNGTDFWGFLDSTTISTVNADNLLISIASQTSQTGLSTSIGWSSYCHADDAIAQLNSLGWWVGTGLQSCDNDTYFITTWKTDNSGSSGSTEITIPTNSGSFTYNYDVDWDMDGNFDDIGVTGDITHDFGTAGTYTIQIRGDFPQIYFNDGGDELKILEVNQWGSVDWQSGNRAFFGCENLEIPANDVPTFDNTTSFSRIFRKCYKINPPMFPYWDVKNVENMVYAFAFCDSLNQDVSDWDVSSVTNLGWTLFSCQNFNQSLNNWDVSNVSNFNFAVANCPDYNQPMDNWDIASTSSLWGLFQNCYAFDQDISMWVVDNITNMSNVFDGCTSFNQDLSAWNVGNVGNFSAMFEGCSSFDQDLSGWNVSSGENFTSMFRSCSIFDQNLNSWVVTNGTNFSYMFQNAPLFNSPLDNWIVSNAESFQGMFSQATGYTQDLSSWDVSTATNFSAMFAYCPDMNLDLSAWNPASGEDFSFMFYEDSTYNQDMSGWSMDSAQVLTFMLHSCVAFDQDLGDWNVENVTSAFYMMEGVTLSIANYDSLLIGWGQQNLQSGVDFSAGNSQYCLGEVARDTMTSATAFDWSITDGGPESVGPTPDLTTLSDIESECEITTLTAPTATDNCTANVTVTNDAVLPISTQGTTVVTWTYTDDHGNTTTQTQNIVISDTTAPVPVSATLPDITATCEVTNTVPPLANDNCAASVTVTSDAVLPITTQGTTVITWSYDDGNGNISTQTQNVIINDTVAPVPDVPALNDITAGCEVNTLVAPTASDNCTGTVSVTHDATLPITTQGTTVVTWTYEDANGNTSTQSQNIILDNGIDANVSYLNDLTLESDQNGATYQWVDCNNNLVPLPNATNQDFVAMVNGNYAVIIELNGCLDTSNCYLIDAVSLDEMVNSEILIFPNPSTTGNFQIQSNNPVASVQFYDAVGRVVPVAFDASTGNIDASHLSSGKYTVRIESSYSSEVRLVLISR